jgi:MarR family transcriptional regulator, organic hydroperoxide resistance regulator
VNEDKDVGKGYPLEPPLAFLRRLWRLSQALERLSTSMEHRFEITAQQRMVLRCIGKFPGITSGALAELLHLDAGTLSTMIHRLIKRRLVERRPDPHDGRRFFLGLSDAGRVLARPTEGTVENAAARLLATEDLSELGATLRILEKLTTLLEDEASAPEVEKPAHGSR